jgi:hypothetical protein
LMSKMKGELHIRKELGLVFHLTFLSGEDFNA